MQLFDYADDIVTRREMSITIISMTIGVGILTLPRTLARSTQYSDGWMSIMLAGALASAAAVLLALLSIRAGRDGYYQFAMKAVGKPAGICVTAAVTIYTLCFS